MELSVGRRNSTVSTSGTSTPSLNRSTANSTLTAPSRRSVERGVAVDSDAVSPSTAAAGIPASLKTRAMYARVVTRTRRSRAPASRPGRRPCHAAAEDDPGASVVAGVTGSTARPCRRRPPSSPPGVRSMPSATPK